ncbi:TlpA family protein disulfide reductase [Heyndrickxia ginsengihumi]|uniref:Thiol-disulfide oxidoreductase n=1 Tax=Heyndrickxia ginsengihumi TaxID=363870 RepID=A0A0A6VCF6_9BACI|nr:TlpA disulfide reductase family protein [Heyndrickxia ginsengihumi]KHD84219.1 thiol-disulfide oxidoreductase [Heyndrickxia ginsengihumi]MCM3022352.1 TlpA family protein disulfide reductase [Heyndrickxia ginsengihumi]
MKLNEKMPELANATEWVNQEVTRDELIGVRPTLIHFWAISCHICKKAMPELNKFRDQYKQQLNVVGVHMPRSENDLDIEIVKLIAKDYGMTQPIYIDNEHRLADAFENMYVPSYYLFDENGRLRHMQAGGSGLHLLEKQLHLILKEMKEISSFYKS